MLPPNLTRRDSLGVERKLAAYQFTSRGLDRQRRELSRGYIQPPSIAKEQRADAWRYVLRDPVVRKAVEVRQHAVAGTDVYFSSKSKANKPLVGYFDDLFGLIPNFDEARLQLTQAIFVGMSWLRILSPNTDSKFIVGADTLPRKWWYPGHLKHYDADRLRLELRRGEELSTAEGDSWRPTKAVWTYADFGSWGSYQNWYEIADDPTRPEWVKMTYHDDDWAMGYGHGLLDSIWFYFYVKTKLLESLLAGIDRFGWPLIVAQLRAGGYTGDSALAGDQYPGSADRAQGLVNILEKQAGAYKVIAIDAEEEINVVAADGKAVQSILEVIAYCDKSMVELILASSMPTGGGEQGSFARAAVEAGSTSSLIKYDRRLHEKALHEIVKSVWLYNQTNWIDLGLWNGRRCPVGLAIGKEETDDPKFWADIANIAVNQLGCSLIREEVFERLGFTVPDNDDDTIDPPGTGGMTPGAGGVMMNPLTGEPTMEPAKSAQPADGVVMSDISETARKAVQQFNDRRAANPEWVLDGYLGSMSGLLRNGSSGDAVQKYLHDAARMVDTDKAEMERLNGLFTNPLAKIGRG